MFTDPQSITVAGVAQSMPRVETSGKKSIYQKADLTYTLTISHQNARQGGKDRIRSQVRVDLRTVVPDPLTSVNDYETLTFYCVVDRPPAGFTQTQVNDLITGFKTWLDSTRVGQLFGQES